ncbi:hypothetical protein GT022_01525 [Agaribacter marinus]|uniref:DUF4129 domain-containing protein n=1 Tax=Virgibacillus salarius TaxID=447199 RepID=A0A941DS68_9BACI|nr:DUF4129 domain-containing protein [Virgibacillus salarius]MBR7794721.1 DUF4129 domain-containing protein [Virgibacillus salarius]NAZ07441.1 hypothetical protein [Agaribacter marinus]
MWIKTKMTKYYQLFYEGILLYFILVPFFVQSAFPVPSWSLIIAVVLLIIIQTTLSKFMNNQIFFIVSISINWAILVLIFSYPILISLAFSLYMTWRFFKHQQVPDAQNQIHIITWLAFFFLIDSVWFFDTTHFWMAAVLLFILIAGYVSSHIQASQQQSLSSLQYIVGIFIAISIISVTLFFMFYGVVPVISFLWFGISQVIVFIGTIFANGIDIAGFDPEFFQNNKKENYEEMVAKMAEEDNPFEALKNLAADGGQSSYPWLWLIGVTLGAILVISLFLYYRKKPVFTYKQENIPPFTSTPLDSKEKNANKKKGRFLTPFRTNSLDQVRQQILKFEKKAQKKGIGRKPTETIEEWFQRLGVQHAPLYLYQAVRYGGNHLTDKERKTFEAHLQKLQSDLALD